MTSTCIGRIESTQGPSVVVIRDDQVWDITPRCPTLSHWLSGSVDIEQATQDAACLGAVDDQNWLAPHDLQPVKACGVTFIDSLLERLVEETARGDNSAAESIRASMGGDFIKRLREIKPGSPEALSLRQTMIEQNRWSQYLEVGLGLDPEVFTKASPLSSVGPGATAGLLAQSDWNNPEPEAVLACSSQGQVLGVTLGNDVNLRDIEGRSALLLGKAKDNRASCVIGPWIRVFDTAFHLADLPNQSIQLSITGTDGFSVSDTAPMSGLARGFEALVQACFDQHDWPDGVLLFTGSPLAPIWDRDQAGSGFTHKDDDQVVIHMDCVGTLKHSISRCPQATPWDQGLVGFMTNLAQRGLINSN